MVLPVYLVVSLWKRPEADRGGWLLKVLYTGTFLLFLFVAGRWDWPGYYLRYIVLVLFMAATVVSYQSAKPRPFDRQIGWPRWRQHGSALVSLVVFAGFLTWAARGRFYSEAPVHLAFPLQGGAYYVAQGGNSTVINYHNRSASQRYALDVVELNALGMRASGVYPAALERYAIFGAAVHSPCDGTVAASVDGLPNLTPPAADRENLAGNHVLIACKGVYVVLAHLHTGSVTVEPGETVETGQLLGRIGNSGNTSEPHLHIHAFRTNSARESGELQGDGVPIVFDGRFAVRNTIFRP